MNENLWKLLEMAKADPALLAALEATRKEADPALALCTQATEKGFPINVGEVFGEGEEYTSNLLKSCNGGASYPLDGWEDAYDLFFASLDALKYAYKEAAFQKKSGFLLCVRTAPLQTDICR